MPREVTELTTSWDLLHIESREIGRVETSAPKTATEWFLALDASYREMQAINTQLKMESLSSLSFQITPSMEAGQPRWTARIGISPSSQALTGVGSSPDEALSVVGPLFLAWVHSRFSAQITSARKSIEDSQKILDGYSRAHRLLGMELPIV